MEKETKDQLEIITSGLASIVAKENIQFVEKSKYDELQRRINEAIEYTNSLEFFELMNSKVNTEYCPKDKAQNEDYFKAKEKLVSILQGEEAK